MTQFLVEIATAAIMITLMAWADRLASALTARLAKIGAVK